MHYKIERTGPSKTRVHVIEFSLPTGISSSNLHASMQLLNTSLISVLGERNGRIGKAMLK